MFSSSIPHYIIWYDKCYPHVHIIVEIHLVGSLDEVSLRPSATSPSSPWFNDELLFWTRSHSSFLENLTLSSHQFVLHLFFSGILSQRYPDTNRIWTSVRYDGWGIFPRVITLVYVWPGKVMTCLAPPAGGPIIIVSFLARLTILPWGNCKDLLYKLFLMDPLCSQSLTFARRPCRCYLEACLWYSDFQQVHLKPNAKCFLPNYPNTAVWVLSWNFVSPT